MTKRLTFSCPYSDINSSRVLMHVYYDETEQPIAQIKADGRLRRVQGVEIFEGLLEKDVEFAASQTESLFLTTVANKSGLRFENKSSGNPGPFWRLRWDSGEIHDFQANVRLETRVRCPLYFGNEPHVQLDFKFDYPQPVTTIQFEYFRELKSNFNGLEINDTGNPQPFKDLFSKSQEITNQSSHRPRLFDFHQFMRDKSLEGDSVWRISFAKILNTTTREVNQKKTGLMTEYVCRTNTAGGWGRTANDAITVWPLQVAPVGVPSGQWDFTLQQAFSGATLPHALRAGQLAWQLKFHSAYDSSLDQAPFGPLATWNRFFTSPYVAALATVKGGTPGSVIPRFLKTFQPAAPTAVWFYDYDFTDMEPAADGKIEEIQFRFAFREFGLTESSALSAQVAFDRFLDHDGKPIERTFLVSHGARDAVAKTIDGVALKPADEPLPLVRFKLSDLANWESAQRSRVGALDLHLSKPVTSPVAGRQLLDSEISASLRGLVGLDPTVGAGPSSFLPEFHASLLLHLFGLSPGGQDPLPQELTNKEDRLPATVVIPASGSVNTGLIKGPFILVAKEDSFDIANQTLALRLENDGSQSQAPLNLIVFDPQPFLVARISANISFATEVGNWDDADMRGAFWELNDDGKDFDLFLPPQVIGEEFIKDYHDVDPSKPLFYKFSPPARLGLSRTPVRQNFSEAPWNLRRLFGLLGGSTPGAGLNSARFELLYGLTTQIKTDFLRLAELDARLGHLPPLLGRKSPVRVESIDRAQRFTILDPFVQKYQTVWEQFLADKNLVLTRLACLHPALLAQKQGVLMLDSDVSFGFRSTRESAHPTGKNTGIFKPHDQGGLRGGVDWGFESNNIHTEVSSSGTSSSGQLVDPWFTALGGSGHQKAGFANDKSTILSTTFVGRNFFYSLQRIGRISVLWNTAKHVIIYERSVIDSEQFDNEPDGKWRGRPIVRKVEEYVEVLQTERNYPEFGAAPNTRGFVLGSRFPKHTKILVDSKWGRDIPGGWIVPLHNPPAIPDAKKLLYPRPDVKLNFATSAETGRAHSLGQLTNPEILYFYTSTDPRMGKDTDVWPPVSLIDFPLEDIPKSPDIHAGVSDAPLPDPPATEAGYDRFTYKLDSSTQTANLLADRASGTTEALIENVTMVRRFRAHWKPTITDPGRQKLEALKKAGGLFASQIDGAVDKVIQKVDTGDLASITMQLAQFVSDANQHVNAARDTYTTNAPTAKQLLQKAQDDLKVQWEKTWNEFSNRTRQRILTELVFDDERFEEHKELIFREVERQIVSAESALNELRDAAQKVLQSFQTAQVNFIALRDGLEDQLLDSLLSINAIKPEAIKQNDPGLLNREIDRYLALAISVSGRVQNEIQFLKNQIGNSYPILRLDAASSDLWKNLTTLGENLVGELFSSSLIADLRAPELEFDYEAYLQGIHAALEDYVSVVTIVDDASGELETAAAGLLADGLAIVNAHLKKLQDEFFDKYDSYLKPALDQVARLFAMPLPELRSKFESEMAKIARTMQQQFFEKAGTAIDLLLPQINIIAGDLQAVEETLRREAETARNITAALTQRLIDEKVRMSSEISQALSGTTATILANVSRALAPYEEQVRAAAARFDTTGLSSEVEKLGDTTLRMVRAYGLAPVAQAMKLNRDRLAYYFDEAKKEIDFTPATVLVNRIGKELADLNLKTVGIRLPSRSLVEQFVSDRLPNFSLKDILPDFAGMNLEKLFPGVRIPQYASDAVKITHGINRETRQAWAKCDVALPLNETVSVFELGPVKVQLLKAQFEAHSEISVDEQGHVQRKVDASIRGDWHLVIMGEAVLMLIDCTLRYNNNGRISFDLKPSSVKLPAALQFLTDLVKSFRPGKASGLSFELVLDGGFPVGVRAVLNLPMPPLQTGAFAVSHIALRSRFEIAAPNGQFYLGVGFSISSRERPFTLTILCLGGGGWIDALAIYKPFAESGKLSARLSIGLAAGADFAFDIGVAAGGVYFLVSLYAEFTFGAGGGMRIALRVAVGGEVVVLGFISVAIELSLEASYESGGSLRCRGELSLSIEICWCFTLEVHQEVEFVLAGSGGSSSNQLEGALHGTGAIAVERTYPEHIDAAVENYFAAFGD